MTHRTVPHPFAAFHQQLQANLTRARNLGDSPAQALARASAAAHARNDQAELQRLADRFSRLVEAGDPEAAAMYREHQTGALGDDPLAEGACDWPDALAEPGRVLTVPPNAPVLGWRMWAVHDDRLVAPFLTEKWGLGPDTPGVTWQPARNTATTRWCNQHRPPRSGPTHTKTGKGRNHRPQPAHPTGSCRCGIRIVQSLTVLHAFADHMVPTLGVPAAYAQVAVWGRVASFAPEDDWTHTARAQHARIVSDLHVHSDYQHVSDRLGQRYGRQTRDW